MGRGMRIAVLGAVVVGSSVGGLAAWYSSPGASSPTVTAVALPPAPPSTAPSTVAPKSDVSLTSPAVPVPDLHAALVTQMRSVLARFAEWSRDHAGAPCPDGAALGVATLDPWGHPIALTCTDQPADQRTGAISAGADGILGNDDDVASWNLGRDVTELVRGARWKSARAPAATPPVAKHSKDRPTSRAHAPAPPATTSPKTAPAAPAAAPAAPPPATTTTKPSAPPIDAGGDDIPARR